MTSTSGPQGNLEPDRGTLILVFGILGLVVCMIFGIIAWVMGKGDLEKIRAGTMNPDGEAMTKVGVILGQVGVALFCIAVLFGVLFGIGGVLL